MGNGLFAQSPPHFLERAQSHLQQFELDSCIFAAARAEQEAITQEDLPTVMKALELQITAYYYAGNGVKMIAKAKEFEQRALEGYDSIKLAQSYNFLGIAHHKLAINDQAFDYFHQALTIGEQLHNDMIRRNILMELAICYADEGYYDKALETYQQRIELLLNDSLQRAELGKTYNNVGEMLSDQGKYTTAIEWYQKAMDVFRSTPDLQPYHMVGTQLNTAIAYYKLERKEEAVYLLNELEETARQLSPEMYVTIKMYQALLKKSDPEFVASMQEVLTLCEANDVLLKQKEMVLRELSAYFDDQGDYAQAFRYYREYAQVKDSIEVRNARNAIDLKNMQGELQQNRMAIDQLTLEKKLISTENRYYITLLAAVLVLSAMMVFFQRRLYAKNQSLLEHELQMRNVQIEVQQLQIDKRESELELNRNKLSNFVNLFILKNRVHARLKQTKILDESNQAKWLDTLNLKILTKEDWKEFKTNFEAVFPGYLYRLGEQHPTLTEAEKRMFLLIKLHVTTDDIADILGISKLSVMRTRQRLSEKLGLESTRQLNDYVGRFNE